MWKSIEGYDGYYEVSDNGEIRSVSRNVFNSQNSYRYIPGAIMKQTVAANGYFVVNLRKNGESKVVLVHRVVAIAFIPNVMNLPTVNHKDGNKHNNVVSNLEWASYSYNNYHAVITGLRERKKNPVIQIYPSGEIKTTYQSVSQAARETGISRGMISHCIHHRSKMAGGYVWEKIKKCNDYPIRSTEEDELPLEAQRRIISEDIV